MLVTICSKLKQKIYYYRIIFDSKSFYKSTNSHKTYSTVPRENSEELLKLPKDQPAYTFNKKCCKIEVLRLC